MVYKRMNEPKKMKKNISMCNSNHNNNNNKSNDATLSGSCMHSLCFHQYNFEYMLCGWIGLSKRDIDGFIQTRCQLICQTIGFADRITAGIWNIQIWEHTVDMSTCFCTIRIATEYPYDWYLFVWNWTLKKPYWINWLVLNIQNAQLHMV